MSLLTYPIQGIPPVPGQPLPLRQEITAWFNNYEQNKYQISLFIQALDRLKKVPIEELLSFFQIAGIHYDPLVGWDGEDRDPNGYCAHQKVTFPTWHRPYIVLYEQVLYETMENLINDWHLADPAVEKIWRQAASQFRLPYWDWARPQEYAKNFAIPQICTLENIDIPIPSGGIVSIPNPLVGFQNPKTDSEGHNVPMGDPLMKEYAIQDDTDVEPDTDILPWSECVATSRYGILKVGRETTGLNGVNNWQAANEAMADPPWYGKGSGSFADAVNRMFSPGYFTSWETFASTIHNDPTQKNATDYMSIEFIHNIVHLATGGQYLADKDIPSGAQGYKGLGLGHMCDPPVAAFDPIFYFHHCNVDRLVAIWQTMNEDMWFDHPQPKDPASNSPLLPFHVDKNKNHWTSDMCRDWTKLHYEYDDLVPQPDAINPDGSINKPRYLADLTAHINTLYPSTSQIVKGTLEHTLAEGKFHDYIINVVYDRYALKGRAYSILFFIGEPPKALSTYAQHDNYVGMVYTFSAPVENAHGSTTCANCAQQQADKVLSKAQIPITLPLLAKSQPVPGGGSPQLPIPGGVGPGALEPDPVAEVLRQELHWEFVELGGKRRDAADFPNTEIAVMHGTGYHAAERHEMARYSGYKKLQRATENKPLGAGHPTRPTELIKDDS